VSPSPWFLEPRHTETFVLSHLHPNEDVDRRPEGMRRVGPQRRHYRSTRIRQFEFHSDHIEDLKSKEGWAQGWRALDVHFAGVGRKKPTDATAVH